MKKYYSNQQQKRDNIVPVPLYITIQENEFDKRPGLKTNHLQQEPKDAIYSLQIELKKLTEKVHNLEECTNTKIKEYKYNTLE